MGTNKMRVLSASFAVGDFMMTDREYDQVNNIWWKVLGIREERDRDGWRLIARRFEVVNKAGYRKEITDFTGAGRRFYKWVSKSDQQG